MIDHDTQDIAGEIDRLTNQRGVDVVIEHVVEATWSQAVFSLARGGPVIDRTFPLAEAAAAHRHLENGKPFGKVVLEV